MTGDEAGQEAGLEEQGSAEQPASGKARPADTTRRCLIWTVGLQGRQTEQTSGAARHGAERRGRAGRFDWRPGLDKHRTRSNWKRRGDTTGARLWGERLVDALVEETGETEERQSGAGRVGQRSG